MPNFNVPNGKLNPNKVYSFIYNMILSQKVTSKNISHEYAKLLNLAKEDVGMFGDQKLYYDTFKPAITDWLGDEESNKLLETKEYRTKSPKTQSLVIDKFKKVVLVLDKYLTKQGWMNESSFADFTSVMMGWIRDVIDMYEMDTYNAFVCTEESNSGKQQVEVDITSAVGAATGKEANILYTQAVAEAEANLFADMADNTSDYMDYGTEGMVRGFEKDDLRIIMKTSIYNKLIKLGEPLIFHKENLLDKVIALPDRFWGEGVNAAATAGDGVKVRSRIYQLVPTTATKDEAEEDQVTVAVAAGQLIPVGYTAPAGTTYNEDVDDKILFKVLHKESVPFISCFEATGSFYNVQSNNTKYVTIIGHNTLEHLAGKPIVTAKKK